MKQPLLVVGIILLAIAIILGSYTGMFGSQILPEDKEINSFDDCIKAGYPAMESYPRQCSDGEQTFIEEHCTKKEAQYTLTLTHAKQIAINSECGDRLKETYICNEFTGTYWFDLDVEKEGCNPACVVNVETREAEINWRCTGLIS